MVLRREDEKQIDQTQSQAVDMIELELPPRVAWLRSVEEAREV